jgi:hypothetical protein
MEFAPPSVAVIHLLGPLSGTSSCHITVMMLKFPSWPPRWILLISTIQPRSEYLNTCPAAYCFRRLQVPQFLSGSHDPGSLDATVQVLH